VVAATNRELEQVVEKKEFHAELFYRLSVLPISLPPLRERPEDIPELVRHFQNFTERGVIVSTGSRPLPN
jgi:transcriptional regulator with GAF, ATPase, and Fis domain